MPDALICYPGSIEKLKLLGVTYLLTYFFRSKLRTEEKIFEIFTYGSDKRSVLLDFLCVPFFGTAATNVPSLPAFCNSNCLQSSLFELKEHLNLLIIASCHPFVHTTHGFTQFSGMHHYPRLSLT
jgi:hypothetical protein